MDGVGFLSILVIVKVVEHPNSCEKARYNLYVTVLLFCGVDMHI